MSSHVIVFVALAGALVACASGEGGPATTPVDPFGTEPAPSGTEPKGGSDQGPPPPPPESTSTEELCVRACERFVKACPNEVCDSSGCANIGAYTPYCMEELRAYLACYATAPIECGPYGPVSAACAGSEAAFTGCINGTY